MPQRASVFCNFYIRVDREALVSERALNVGSVAFKAMSTKNIFSSLVIESPSLLTIFSEQRPLKFNYHGKNNFLLMLPCMYTNNTNRYIFLTVH
jgi:hypothetical protein